MKKNTYKTLKKLARNHSDYFLDFATTHNDRVILSHQYHVSYNELLRLVSYFDIMRVTGVTSNIANILIGIGIKGVEDLRLAKADTILQKIQEAGIDQNTNYQSYEDIQALIVESIRTPLKVLEMQDENIQGDALTYTQLKNDFQVQELAIKPSFNSVITKLFIVSMFSLLASLMNQYFLLLIPIYLLLILSRDNDFSNRVLCRLRKRVDRLFIKKPSCNRFITKYSGILSKSIVLTSCILLSIIFSIGIVKTGALPLYATIINSTENSSYLRSGYFSKNILKELSDESITRGELIYILVQNTNNLHIKNRGNDCFHDIQESAFAYEICFAKSQGFVSGDVYNNFNPDDTVSHAAGLKFILKFYGYNVPTKAAYITFEDLDRSDWYASYAEFAKRKNIIPQNKERFEPKKSFTIKDLDMYLARINK